MPAHRSRTERWRDSLQQIYERGGGIEFSIARTLPYEPPLEDQPHNVTEESDHAPSRVAPDLMWRVRVVGLSETEILVEKPGAMGTTIDIGEGVEVVVVLAVGQNRWMFHSRTLGKADASSHFGGAPNALRLAMPTKVERCHRREFLRISTAQLTLPIVECWPLLDPTTVVVAEAANRVYLEDIDAGRRQPATSAGPAMMVLPEVGPVFTARLLNLSGGGVGLIFSKAEMAAADRARYVWLRLNLTPVIPAPIAMTARIVHKHLDSEQNLTAGASFDFTFNPAHRDFVVAQINRFVGKMYPKSQAA